MNDVTIRPAVRSDVPGILDIVNYAIAFTTANADYEPHSLSTRETWFDEHVRDGYPIFVAVADGKVVGWSSLSRFHPRIGYRLTSETSVYIATEYQARGLGSALMTPVIDAARERGLHLLVALISADNDASIKLHTRLGFEHAGLLKHGVTKFGKWQDVVYMQLLLNDDPPPEAPNAGT